MSHTVVGFFEDQSEARQALEQLHSKGISRESVDISRGGSSESVRGGRSSETDRVNPVSNSERDENSVRRTSDDRTVDSEGRNTNVFTDFFNNLLGGSKTDHAERYSDAAQRSGAVVTVHATSREEAERAAEIMDDCGAMDVDKKASESEGLSGSSTSERSNVGSSNSMRSRIFDGRLNENYRLKDFDSE
jgi:hypothetical protein